MSLIKQIYKPSQLVGQVYAKAYGVATAPRLPVGNVLSLELSHEEEVQRQPDMTRLGGGTYASTRRITSAALAMELADWNPVNFARSVRATSNVAAGAAVVAEEHVARLGSLIRLELLNPSLVAIRNVVVPAAPVVVAADQYEVRPEGIWLPDVVAGVAEGDPLEIDYTHPEMVTLEALTGALPEIELTFGGLNEADSGKPVVIDVWRVAQGVSETLSLIQSEMAALAVNGEVMRDPTKTGVGISPFYRVQMV